MAKRSRRWASALVAACVLGGSSQAEEVNLEALAEKVAAMEAELADLKSGASAAVSTPVYGLAPAASKVYHLKEGVSLGGYGEFVYQNYDGQKDDGTASGQRDTLDLLRFVLYVGYRFSDKFVFNSEVEFEHTTEGTRGEISVEAATLDYLAHPGFNVRGGLLLLPVGFLNELHEPPIFHGALRPNVEGNIIPTTWRENGLGFFGESGPFSYRAYLVNGGQAVKDTALGTGAISDKVKGYSASSGIRGGRQKGSLAFSEDWAGVARVDVAPAGGLTAGGSIYHGDAGQGAMVAGQRLEATTTLWETHAEWNWRGLEARGLYSRVSIAQVDLINAAQGVSGASSVGERLWGGYGQLAFNVLSLRETQQYLAPFVRYERYNTQAKTPDGTASNPANDRMEWTYGLTYRPISPVVVKAEFQNRDNRAGTGVDQWNAALGYMF